MKQKLAIVVTFMSNPDVIILDEPSTGLDPLMQKKLIDLIKEEKQKGKTIFLSSHIFEEIEDVADRICFIKNGMIVENKDIDTIYRENRQTMIATFNSNVSDKLKIPFKIIDKNKVAITIDNNINNIITELASYDVKTISMKNVSLRKIFERYYIDEVN